MMDKTKVNNILFLTLSNIGDVVLTLPVLGVLEREFPNANITVMVSEQAKEIFQHDPKIAKVITYNKRIPFSEKITLGLRLRKRNFDLIVDLRSTLYPLLAGAPYRTSLFTNKARKEGMHKRDFHLSKLTGLGLDINEASYDLFYGEEDILNVKNLLKQLNISDTDKIVAIAPGAKSHIKQWPIGGFAKVALRLNRELGIKVLLLGDKNDKEMIAQILSFGLNDTYDMAGRTNLRELAYILSFCRLLITNDSAPLHLGSLVKTPVVAIFGPTDDLKYGPVSQNSVVIKKGLKCSPCEKAQCVFNLECLRQINADDVFEAAKRILSGL